MAFENINPLDTKKKKIKPLIQPRITEQGAKLFGTEGVKTPVPTIPIPESPRALAPKLTPQLTPVAESDNARFARERFEAEQAFAAKNGAQGIPDPTTALGTDVVQDAVQDVVQPKEVGQTREDIQSSLLDASTNRQLNALKAALAKTKSGLEAEQTALAPAFRQAESGVRTRDTMARAGTEKFLGTQGLGEAGAVGQSDIAQRVITQGAIGALNEQEIALKADIKQRLAQAEIDFASGEFDIINQREQQDLQFQLEQITAKENAALKQAEINDQREFDLFIRELDKKDEQELTLFENSLKQDNTILDARIQEAADERKFGQVTALEAIKAANNIKLQAVRDSAAISRIRASGAQSLEQIEARGEQDRLTDTAQEQFKAAEEADAPEDKFSSSEINSSINNAISTAKAGLETFEITPRTEKDAVIKWIVDNIDEELSGDQQDKIIFDFGLTPADEAQIVKILDGREQFDPAKGVPTFPILPQ